MKPSQMVAIRIRQLRGARLWTQDELAERTTQHGCAISRTAIAKIETGAQTVTVDELAAFAACFGVRLQDIITAGIIVVALDSPEATAAGLIEGDE